MRTMDSLPSQLTEPIVVQNHRAAVEAYLGDTRLRPLLLLGDAHVILEQVPESSIDVVMTSPPYWGKRDYADGGIGMEPDYHCYIQHLAQICLRIKRVLKPGGSFWLNLGDTYHSSLTLIISIRRLKTTTLFAFTRIGWRQERSKSSGLLYNHVWVLMP